MIECHPVPDTNIIEMIVDGNVTREEFDQTLSLLTNAIQEHGKIRVLKVIHSLGDLTTVPVSELWEDIRFGFDQLVDVTHCAIVSDHDWLEMMAKSLNPLLKLDVECFPLSEIDDARAWLLEAESPSGNNE